MPAIVLGCTHRLNERNTPELFWLPQAVEGKESKEGDGGGSDFILEEEMVCNIGSIARMLNLIDRGVV